MTEKLYWADPHKASFEAASARVADFGGKPSIVLEQSLFYPEGGGQLGDVGTLSVGGAELAIVDTQIDDTGVIHHLVGATPSALEGAVRGTIDLGRRRDHMAQHTAQHALSRALLDIAKAETVSARLGATACTIDVQRPGIPDAELHRAEDLVNQLIASDLEIRALYPTADELATMKLRRPPKVSEGIRIIDIDGFDLTPCGGTHCTRTGQIGQARIVGVEKYKGMLRLTFHAGLRALTDARAKHDALAALATELTVGVPEVPNAVARLRADLKNARGQLESARGELAELLAAALLAKLPSDAGTIVLPVERANDDIAALRTLANKLTTDARVIAVLGATDPTSGELIVIVQGKGGGGSAFDCGALIKRETAARGGKGGGRPDRAEGRFPKGTLLSDLAAAAELSAEAG